MGPKLAGRIFLARGASRVVDQLVLYRDRRSSRLSSARTSSEVDHCARLDVVGCRAAAFGTRQYSFASPAPETAGLSLRSGWTRGERARGIARRPQCALRLGTAWL